MSNDVLTAPPTRRVPGEVGIWVFIFGDLTMFTLFFFSFLYERSYQQDVFTGSQQHLNVGLGSFNTILLLTGSLLVVNAVHTAASRPAQARRQLLLAVLTGAWFLVDKVYEYSELTRHGYTPATNDFFMYYYVFTGIHAVHLIVGMIVLLLARRTVARPVRSTGDLRFVETAASYWHLVDLLWIVLFALLFVLN